MARYVIWDKKSDIFTPGVDKDTGKAQWTAQEYINYHAPWASNPAVKIVVGGGVINGTIFMEFEAMSDHYKRMGAPITDDMSDREALDAIQEFEDAPRIADIASPQERIAAALEFQNLLTM